MTRILFISGNDEPQAVEAENGQSLMQTALFHGIAGVEALCGGASACGTCHVYIEHDKAGALVPAEQTEQDLLDFLTLKRENSRLACQIQVAPELDGLVVRMPEFQEG